LYPRSQAHSEPLLALNQPKFSSNLARLWCGRRDLNPRYERGRPRNPFTEKRSRKSYLAAFRDFCLIDLQLCEGTTKMHLRNIKRFLKWAGMDPSEVTNADIREYLMRFKDANSYTYANVLKSLRVFFGHFMQIDIANSFKFPQAPLMFKPVPTREQLKKFYKTLETQRDKALFLMLATSGLRRGEVASLTFGDIDLEKRMIVPCVESTTTKRRWMSFFNPECASVLREYINGHDKGEKSARLFPIGEIQVDRIFRNASAVAGIKVTPQTLREWFACEMGALNVPDRFVDAFCGRVPRSVLARHYTDYSPERLKAIYDKAGIRVLS
jgi:integrase